MRIRSVFSHSAQAVAEGALISVLVVGLMAGTAFAGKPSGGGGGHKGGTACTTNAPGIAADNNWAWSAPGSWGTSGQQLSYLIRVVNYDIGCGSSSFVVSISAPSGFSVSIPTSSITLSSSSSAYLWSSVTSPVGIADGDYPLTLGITRSGTTGTSASSTTYYKVYSSDTVAPTLFWWNPGDGQAISDSSYNVTVSSIDDHAVEKIDVYIDNTYKSTTLCDNIAYTCQLNYKWSTVQGQHTATFKSYDWMGNAGTVTVGFTVN
jgi:hypothetical protein